MKLRNKFLALLLPTGLVAASLILFLIRQSVHSIVLGELKQSTSVLAKSAAQDAVPGFEARSEVMLLPQLQELQKRQRALYAAALDSHGVVLAHTTITEKGKLEEDPLTQAALQSDKPIINTLRFHGEPVLEVSVPVWSAAKISSEDSFLLSGDPKAGSQARLGVLKVGVPLRPSQETENRIIRNVSLIIIVIGFVALGLVLFLIRGILGPITGLMEGIARIGQGQYDLNVPVLSQDELGDLAQSFNVMSAELSRTTVSKEYVEGIIDNMSDPLVVTDPEGSIEKINPAAIETLCYSSSELVGHPLTTLFNDDAAALQRGIPDLLAAGAIRDREVTLKAKLGRSIPSIFSASVLKDRHGRPRGYVCVAKDITERKRAEEALLAAKASAEASSAELESFSYSVSHDLRAPLRGIMGFSQIVLEDSAATLDDAGKENLNRVVKACKLMGTLIDDMLELSRVSRTAMEKKNVDLSDLAKSIVRELQERDLSRRVEFVVRDGIFANGDAHLLRIALVNLIGNAWKYSGKQANARIEFGTSMGEKGQTIYYVRDNGAGFDMAYSGKLFGVFQRLHAQSEFEGTGVGLATVQRVIRRHGGKIWAESAVGKGATFYFTL